jgi:hypothetical protein
MLLKSEEIKPLLEQRARVFPVHGINAFGFCTCGDPSCGTPGKHPATPRGVNNARVGYLIRDDDKNYGVACGEEFCVLDIDPRNLTEARLNSVLTMLAATKTWVVCTGGSGYHYYFKGQKGLKSKVLEPGVEFQGEGKYVVGPGSKHKSGKYYEWEDISHPSETKLEYIPLWILEQLERKSELIIQEEAVKISDAEFRTIASNLATINPCVGYEKWINIGMALHATGWGKDAFELWNDFSLKDKDKYKSRDELERKWRSFKTVRKNDLGRGAITAQLITHMAQEQLELDTTTALLAQRDKQCNDINNVCTLKDNLELKPKGIVKELAEWVYNNAPRAYWQWAVASAFSIVATCAQGKYVTIHEQPISISQLILGQAAIGKDHYLNSIFDVLWTVDKRLVMSEAASSAGFRETLYCFNSRAWIVDEVQDFFNKMINSNNVHIQGILKDMKEIFGARRVLLGRTSKGSKTSDICMPTMSFIGFGTPQEMNKLMNDSSINGGFISRLIQWPLVKPVNKKQDLVKELCPGHIILKLRDMFESGLTYNETMDEYFKRIEAVTSADKKKLTEHLTAVSRDTVVKLDDDAMKLFKEYEKQKDINYCNNCEDDNAATEDRAPNIALRFATIHCVGCDRNIINVDDMTIALDIVRLTVDRSKAAVDESKETSNILKIIKCLKRYDGEVLNIRFIANSTRLKINALKEEILDMQYRGLVVLTSPEGETLIGNKDNMRGGICVRLI